jgi:hypothetical protein
MLFFRQKDEVGWAKADRPCPSTLLRLMALTYNYAAGLKANYKFKLVLLVDEAFGVEQGELRANERVFGPISVVLVRRRSKSCRITSELLGKDMFN